MLWFCWNCVNCCHAMLLNCFSGTMGVMWALKTWFLNFLVKNTIFCTSGLMIARLSVHCTLKRAKCRNYRLYTLTGSLKRTGKRTTRLQARLSVQPFYSMPWKTSLWSRVSSDDFLANHYNFITLISKTFNIKSIICITLCDSLIKCMSNIHEFNGPWLLRVIMTMLGRDWYIGVGNT